jgi:hypothetical protein
MLVSQPKLAADYAFCQIEHSTEAC